MYTVILQRKKKTKSHRIDEPREMSEIKTSQNKAFYFSSVLVRLVWRTPIRPNKDEIKKTKSECEYYINEEKSSTRVLHVSTNTLAKSYLSVLQSNCLITSKDNSHTFPSRFGTVLSSIMIANTIIILPFCLTGSYSFTMMYYLYARHLLPKRLD